MNAIIWTENIAPKHLLALWDDIAAIMYEWRLPE